MSGSRKDAAVLRSHPRLCGMTTTQTCEALQQAHRLLGDTYIKQLPVPCLPQSHMGEHVRQELCLCRCHRFDSFPPSCASYYQRLFLILHDICTVLPPLYPKNFAASSPVVLLCTPLPDLHACTPPRPPGLMEDSQRSVREVRLRSEDVEEEEGERERGGGVKKKR